MYLIALLSDSVDTTPKLVQVAAAIKAAYYRLPDDAKGTVYGRPASATAVEDELYQYVQTLDEEPKESSSPASPSTDATAPKEGSSSSIRLLPPMPLQVVNLPVPVSGPIRQHHTSHLVNSRSFCQRNVYRSWSRRKWKSRGSRLARTKQRMRPDLQPTQLSRPTKAFATKSTSVASTSTIAAAAAPSRVTIDKSAGQDGQRQKRFSRSSAYTIRHTSSNQTLADSTSTAAPSDLCPDCVIHCKSNNCSSITPETMKSCPESS